MKSKKMMAMLLSTVMCTGLFGVNVQADAEDEVTLTFGFWGDDAEAQMKMRLARFIHFFLYTIISLNLYS